MPTRSQVVAARLLVLLAAVGAVFFLLTSVSAGTPPGPSADHAVRPGESLWEIAAEHAAPGSDLRVVVDEIIELNQLEGGDIQAGQRILVPAT